MAVERGELTVHSYKMAMMANGPMVTSDAEIAYPAEGPKHSKKGQNDREACQIHAHTAEKLKDFNVIWICE